VIQFEGKFDVQITQSDADGFFRDISRVVPCLPDLRETQSVEKNAAVVVLNVGVGPIRGPMTMRLEVRSTAGEPIVYHGHGSGVGRSIIDVEAGVTPVSRGADETEVQWYGKATVSGGLASLGAGLLEPIVKHTLNQFIANLQRSLVDHSASAGVPDLHGSASSAPAGA
jgi:carbon monoxide dehydrogenase subunit G